MSYNDASDGPRDPIGNRRCFSSREDSVKSVTGCMELAYQAPWAKFNTSVETMGARQMAKMATWNVRGLLHPDKLLQVEKELSTSNITIVELSETHYKNTGHFTSQSGNTICFSGNDNLNHNGVGFWISKTINKSILGYNPISDRMIILKINAKPMIVNMIQIYAPTSTSDNDVMESFYKDLEGALATLPNREIVIIMGDFNFKVGSTLDDKHLRAIIGRHGLGERNERGERFIQFCLDNNYTIANTMFAQHLRRLYTWTSPGGRSQPNRLCIDQKSMKIINTIVQNPIWC